MDQLSFTRSLANLSAVPDFRSTTGLFSTLRSEHKLKASGKHLFDASVYQTDSSTSSFHDMVRSLSKLVSNARPTAFHEMLAALASEGRLMRLYTQNVDGIDTSLPPLMTSVPLSMKGPWPRTIQLHGGLEKMVCSKCNHLSDFQASLFEGPSPPLCAACLETDKVRTDHAGKRSHGIGRLRPRIVLYNEHNPDEEAIGTVVSADLRTRPDAVIVVGTSMKIPGVRRIVREMCGVVRSRRDGLAVWVNHEPPPVGKEFEDCFDLIVKGACDDVASHADMKRWDEDGLGADSNPEDDSSGKTQLNTGEEVSVVIRSHTKTSSDHTMMTPAPSPRPKSSRSLPINMEVRVPSHLNGFNSKKCTASKGITKTSTLEPRSKSSKAAAAGPPTQKKTSSKPSHKPISKRKSATKLPVKNPTTIAKPKITSAFSKVTKMAHPPQLSPSAPKRRRGKQAPVLGSFETISPGPMALLSPQDARNNGPVSSFPSPVKPSLFPNLLTIKPKPVAARQHTRRNSRQESRKEIVSPTCAIPTGMGFLLHLESAPDCDK